MDTRRAISLPVISLILLLAFHGALALTPQEECPDQIIGYDECLEDYDITVLLETIKLKWNKPLYEAAETTHSCSALRSILACLKTSSESCDSLRQQYGQLFITHHTLRAVQEICFIEVKFNDDTKGPIVKSCDNDLTTIVEELKVNCALEVDYSNAEIVIQDICRAMQQQIDCVLPYQDACPAAVAKFLGPRMDSYGVANRYCDNVTANGITLKPIPIPGGLVECDYRKVYDCMSAMGYLGPDYNSLNSRSIIGFFEWNVFNNTLFCMSFLDYNPKSNSDCTIQLLWDCPLPVPVFGTYDPIYPDPYRYNHDTYTLLAGGPTPFNQYGPFFIGERRNYMCYDTCSEYIQQNQTLSNDCESKATDKASQVITDQSNGSPITEPCGLLQEGVTCIGDTSAQCPFFYERVKAFLQQTDISAAMNHCGIQTPDLLPENHILTSKRTTVAASPTPPHTADTRTTPTRDTTTTTTTTTVAPSVGASSSATGADMTSPISGQAVGAADYVRSQTSAMFLVLTYLVNLIIA